jgi:cytochrome P450
MPTMALEALLPDPASEPREYHDHLRRARETGPVLLTRSESPRTYVALGYDAVATVLADSETFTPAIVSERYGPVLGDDTPVALTGWRHRAHRQVLVRELSGVAFREHARPIVEAAVRERIDHVLGTAGPIDLVDAIALRLPVAIITSLLGLDRARADELRIASAALLRFADEPRRGFRAARWLRSELSAEIATRAAMPRPDLLTRLVDGPEALPAQTAVTVALLLLAAGVETSCDALSTMLAIALRADEHTLCRWAAEPEPFVEELLRWESPAQLTVRSLQRDATIAGVDLERGDTILAHLGAANRDPAVFDDPGTLDPKRQRARRHLGFGIGEHRCPGRDIARAELCLVAEALPELVSRVAIVSELPHVQGNVFRNVPRLPVTLAPAASRRSSPRIGAR